MNTTPPLHLTILASRKEGRLRGVRKHPVTSQEEFLYCIMPGPCFFPTIDSLDLSKALSKQHAIWFVIPMQSP